MNCKGLVELIVLNLGLQNNVINQKTFTIFVVMALITTFITTPVVSYRTEKRTALRWRLEQTKRCRQWILDVSD